MGETKERDLPPVSYSDHMGIPAEVMGRLGDPKSLEGLSPEELSAVVKEYYQRWVSSEDEKYDLEYSVKLRDLQIQELDGSLRHEGKIHHPQAQKGSCLQAHGQ